MGNLWRIPLLERVSITLDNSFYPEGYDFPKVIRETFGRLERLKGLELKYIKDDPNGNFERIFSCLETKTTLENLSIRIPSKIIQEDHWESLSRILIHNTKLRSLKLLLRFATIDKNAKCFVATLTNEIINLKELELDFAKAVNPKILNSLLKTCLKKKFKFQLQFKALQRDLSLESLRKRIEVGKLGIFEARYMKPAINKLKFKRRLIFVLIFVFIFLLVGVIIAKVTL